jgi:hypothetical protein
MIDKSKAGRQTPKESTLSLRAQGKAPIPNYIIKPVAGSLIGDVPALRDDLERTNAVVERMLRASGVQRPSPEK